MVSSIGGELCRPACLCCSKLSFEYRAQRWKLVNTVVRLVICCSGRLALRWALLAIGALFWLKVKDQITAGAQDRPVLDELCSYKTWMDALPQVSKKLAFAFAVIIEYLYRAVFRRIKSCITPFAA
jgi:hypothetical protein